MPHHPSSKRHRFHAFGFLLATLLVGGAEPAVARPMDESKFVIKGVFKNLYALQSGEVRIEQFFGNGKGPSKPGAKYLMAFDHPGSLLRLDVEQHRQFWQWVSAPQHCILYHRTGKNPGVVTLYPPGSESGVGPVHVFDVRILSVSSIGGYSTKVKLPATEDWATGMPVLSCTKNPAGDVATLTFEASPTDAPPTLVGQRTWKVNIKKGFTVESSAYRLTDHSGKEEKGLWTSDCWTDWEQQDEVYVPIKVNYKEFSSAKNETNEMLFTLDWKSVNKSVKPAYLELEGLEAPKGAMITKMANGTLVFEGRVGEGIYAPNERTK